MYDVRRRYVVSFKDCRKLILFLKKWFIQCNLYGPLLINSYAIAWFTIFFLQMKKLVPSVLELIENKSILVDGWQCDFQQKVSAKLNNCCFKELLHGFFAYYAEFNFKDDVVCPFLGKVLKKNDFKYISSYPEEIKAIYLKRLTLLKNKDETMEVFKSEKSMCIQNPVDLSQNITKAIEKTNLRLFKYYCYESSKLIEKYNKSSMKFV